MIGNKSSSLVEQPASHSGKRSAGSGDFKRAYKACIRCRKSKAKCETSDTHAQCTRCRRERKDCVFTAERSTCKRRRPSRLQPGADVPGSPASEQHSERNTASQFIVQGAENAEPVSQDDPPTALEGLPQDLPWISFAGDTTSSRDGAAHVGRRSAGVQCASNAGPLVPVDLDTDVMQTVVSSSKDALGLLFKAAEQQEVDDYDGQSRPTQENGTYNSPDHVSNVPRQEPLPVSQLSNPSKEIINLWKQHRFVRQGWFSAREAVTYVDLFFRNLSNFTLLPDLFCTDDSYHTRLISEEPLLCCTIIMVSSRFHVLPGQGGTMRSHFIHTRLWKHVEHLIQRITLGQEKYSVAKSRTLGSIQALLLITEWHPKALHFPPENDGWDASLAPSIDDSYCNRDRNEDIHLIRWREEVFEPAKRTDRMSWMLLGLATSLAHELGVFQEMDTGDESEGEVAAEPEKLRVRKLLFLYVNQLALRLGCTSMLPASVSLPVTSPPQLIHNHEDQVNYDRDILLSQWIGLTQLLKTATDVLFPSKSSTRRILRTGRYVSLLQNFQPLLSHWFRGFMDLNLPSLSDVSKQMILLDYSFVRMYINSIAIQGIVERVNAHPEPERRPSFDFLTSNHAAEYRFVNEVVQASCDALTIAAEFGESGMLRFWPVRSILQLVSASIFLLKALSVGTTSSNIEKSLGVLDRCITALTSRCQDDILMSERYGMLIARHFQRFRKNFRGPSGGTVGRSAAEEFSVNTASWQGRSGSRTEMQPNIPVLVPGRNSSIESPDALFDTGFLPDDWLVQPFDPSIAPFGLDINSSALRPDSLDFLWNLPV